MRRVTFDPSYEKLLPEKEAEKFRKLYNTKQTNCLCGHDLSREPIVYYVPHSDGWTVEGEQQKVWLYVKCPKCGYDMAIWKIGVPREPDCYGQQDGNMSVDFPFDCSKCKLKEKCFNKTAKNINQSFKDKGIIE